MFNFPEEERKILTALFNKFFIDSWDNFGDLKEFTVTYRRYGKGFEFHKVESKVILFEDPNEPK